MLSAIAELKAIRREHLSKGKKLHAHVIHNALQKLNRLTNQKGETVNNTIKLAENDAGNTQLAITPVPALQGDHHSVSIGTQWLVAKNPHEVRERVQLTLEYDDLVRLHQFLGRYLAAN